MKAFSVIVLHGPFRSTCLLQDQVGSNFLAPARKTESRASVPGGEMINWDHPVSNSWKKNKESDVGVGKESKPGF